MSINSFFSRYFHPQSLLYAGFLLFALACSTCGTIHKAAKTGNTARIKVLLKNNLHLISSKDSYGCSPLNLAAEFGHKDLVVFLLANKADVNAKDNNGNTPLHQAAVNGYTDVVELLLANGADINAKNDIGCTPLHFSAIEGYKNVVKLLLVKGAGVNAKMNDGSTPLHLTVRHNPDDLKYYHPMDVMGVVEVLLAGGADINAKDNGGWTPLHDAEVKGYKEAAELMRQHGDHE